jgi:uncharacterized protein (DUF1015 family)
MANIKAFKGLIYNRQKISDFAKVVAPPYDVIDEKIRNILYKNSSYNVIRLILNKAPNPYKEAEKLFNRWVKNKILIEDNKEAIYLYQQTFKSQGKNLIRIGFLSLMKLDLDGNYVLFHETTSLKPKRDRLNLLKEVEANLSPVFSLFSDSKRRFLNEILPMAKKKLIADFYFDNVKHQFYHIEDSNFISELIKFMKRKKVMIADGHHRYEVALGYCRKQREKMKVLGGDYPFDWVLMYFAPLEQESINILPTHRIIKANFNSQDLIEDLKKCFKIRNIANKNKMFKELKNKKSCLGIYIKGKFFTIEFAKKDLISLSCDRELKKFNVSLLHDIIFDDFLNIDDKKDVCYTHNEEEVIKLVDNKGFKIGFFLNAPTPREVKKVAEKNLRMPYKSTYFYPKILTGLVIHKF